MAGVAPVPFPWVEERRPPIVIAGTALAGAEGGAAEAAAVGTALARRDVSGDRSSRRLPALRQPRTANRAGALLFAELASPPVRRGPTVLASPAALALEKEMRESDPMLADAAARGHICHLPLPADDEGVSMLDEIVLPRLPAGVLMLYLPSELWAPVIEDPGIGVSAALLRADLPKQRPLAALAVMELRERGIRTRIATRPLGRVASRRALGGAEPGGEATPRAARLARGLAPDEDRARVDEWGQALPLVLAAALAVIFAALILAAIGGAVTAKGRVQRAADLAAVSAARSMRDDFTRLFVPTRLPGGAPNPGHLYKAEYLARAEAAAREAASRNDVPPSRVRVSFPDAGSIAPIRARTRVAAEVDPDALPGDGGRRAERIPVAASAVAEAGVPIGFDGMPAMASGGGYSGPLAYRQGKPMRPDVAEAFDRMEAAARGDGISLLITSAYRSDAEQAQLFARNPDPRWVAPPGQSLHRCATELDLGPSTAYGWLVANAQRFGFVQRYSWEPWHYGYTRGPAPCSAEESVGGRAGGKAPSGGLPAFVPDRYREPIERAASRWNVSAGLLAAQLMVESNFNPHAVSPAGAAGIAQFMPGTAATYGLRDPFDAAAAIDAQAHLMSDLLRQFGSVPLALAAYNAGPSAVAACDCVPAYPETQAYVARILGLLEGAGELFSPPLEVRLVQ